MHLLRCSLLALGLAAGVAVAVTPAQAGTVNAAVAANFTQVATDLAADFKAKTGNEVRLSFGATGALYAQITQGAPFDVFLSADEIHTKTAIRDGFGVGGSDFTYAIGKVVLYSPTIDVADGAAVLRAGAFQHLALADPKTAPYGRAGLAVLDKLGLTDAVEPKLVTAENITQAQQFVDSGNAELGFVALSQVLGKPPAQVWSPPQEDYPVIVQGAVLLKEGADNPAARDFLAYLQSDEAKAVIKAAGYGTT